MNTMLSIFTTFVLTGLGFAAAHAGDRAVPQDCCQACCPICETLCGGECPPCCPPRGCCEAGDAEAR